MTRPLTLFACLSAEAPWACQSSPDGRVAGVRSTGSKGSMWRQARWPIRRVRIIQA